MQDRQWPAISVIVPVRNEAGFIARTLEQILGQDYPPDRMEVLVGVADSTDGTWEIVHEVARRDPRVRLFCNPHGLSSGARNLGVRFSTGDIIVFIDGHVHIDNPRLLRDTVLLMEEKGVSVLSRPQFLEPPDISPFQRAVALARGSRIGHGLDSTIYTRDDKYVDPTSAGASYRRDVFQRVGLFDPSFDACEDVEFNYRCARAGYRAFTSMRLAVYYYPRETARSLLRQMKRYGIGRARLARKHPATLSLAAITPALFLLGVLLLSALAPFSRAAFMGLAACLGLYLVLIAGFSLATAARHGLRLLPVLPLIYAVIHAGLGFGFLQGIIVRAAPPPDPVASQNARSRHDPSRRQRRARPGGHEPQH